MEDKGSVEDREMNGEDRSQGIDGVDGRQGDGLGERKKGGSSVRKRGKTRY